MRSTICLSRAALLMLLVCGCGPTAATPPPARQAFVPITIHYGVYLARLDVTSTIDAAGVLREVRVTNKSYGPRDIDPANTKTVIREGRLTDEQLAELNALIARWPTNPRIDHVGVPDGPDITIDRGGQRITGGRLPEPVEQTRRLVDALAQTMPPLTHPDAVPSSSPTASARRQTARGSWPRHR